MRCLQGPRNHLASREKGAAAEPGTWEPASLLARAVLPFVGREASELKLFQVPEFPAFLSGTMLTGLTK